MLATTGAVIAGITYNFLPFMILPLYAIARADRPAAARGGLRTSTATAARCSRRSRCRCRLPGIVAGVLLTFIPAAGDFINAALLGTPRQTMIGNVIQSRYLEINDYPTAAALSFIADGDRSS